jgi:hypothetical protein
MRCVLTVAATVAVLGATMGSAPVDAASRTADYTDPSGLLVVMTGHDRIVPEAQRDSYAAYDALSEANPEDFGYASPNIENGKVSLAVVSAKGEAALVALEGGGKPTAATTALRGESAEATQKRAGAGAQAAPRGRGLQVNATHTGRSRASVERDKDALIDWSKDPRFAEADLWQTSVESSTGRVIVTVAKLTPALAEAIVAAYGTADVVVQVAPNPQLETNIGRLVDNSPFYAGSRINVPLGSCTNAFSWNIGSIPAMVTAGHCVPTGGSVRTPSSAMGSVTSGTRESWNTGVGTVTVPGFSGYHGDGAIIAISSGKTSYPYIYRGAYNAAGYSRVLGMWSRRALAGDKYCTGGSFGGEICGWTVSATQVNVAYGGGVIGRNEVRSGGKQGACTRSGDSGGSVFTASATGVTAKGVHNGGGGGGSDNYGGVLDQCTEVFTDIWDIYYGLPGSLDLG